MGQGIEGTLVGPIGVRLIELAPGDCFPVLLLAVNTVKAASADLMWGVKRLLKMDDGRSDAPKCVCTGYASEERKRILAIETSLVYLVISYSVVKPNSFGFDRQKRLFRVKG